MARSSERQPAGVQIAAVTCARDLDLRAVAAPGAWGRQPSVTEVEKVAAALGREIAGLDPATRGIFIAHESGVPVGACRAVQDRDTAAHWWLMGIVVHPDHRRRGIGRALALEALGYA